MALANCMAHIYHTILYNNIRIKYINQIEPNKQSNQHPIRADIARAKVTGTIEGTYSIQIITYVSAGWLTGRERESVTHVITISYY